MTTFVSFAQGLQTLPSTRPTVAKILALPAYHWSLLAFLSVLLAHVGSLPLWLLTLLGFSVAMQKPSIKQRIRLLSGGHLQGVYHVVQLSLFVAALVALWLTQGQTLSVEVAVGFLMLCFMGKIWELRQKRDAYVALNLGLFVLASAFLLRQDLSVVLAGLPSLLMILMAFVVMSDDANLDGAGRWRALMMLCVPAVPLLVVLFVFFPRIPPIWSLPLSHQSATTGMSDSMSPGDFSNLSQSTKLAFRVEFASSRPPREQLYWRGLVFGEFDGVTWRPSDMTVQPWLTRDTRWISQARLSNQSYRVILEPTQQNWLFALDYPKLPHKQANIMVMRDLTLRRTHPVTKQIHYEFDYHMAKHDLLDVLERQVYVGLPKQSNPKSKAFASSLFAQVGYDPVKYIASVQHYINTQGFSYTLSPPLLKGERIDEFLFGTRAGFCEHYASSFTFLMRAVGIPARVVAGYQGGELGRDGKSWEVRQMDAHAWSEVWLVGQGWVRIDPTAFVSPERISVGMNALTQESGAQMFGDGVAGQWGYRQFQLLQTLRRYSDQVGYYWQREIVGFDQDKQKQSLFKWFKIASFAEQFWTLVATCLLLGLMFGLYVYQQRKKRHHPLDLPLLVLSKRLAKQHPELAKYAYEPYLTWLDRVDKCLNKAKPISELKTIYRKYRYSKDGHDEQAIKQIKQLGKKLLD